MAIIVSDSLVVRIAKKEGEKVSTLGICPAIADPTFNVFNQGINAGRIYWFLAETFCRGKVQGSFAEQQAFCESCEFYKHLHAEEGTTNIYADNKNIFLNTHLERVRESNQNRHLIKKLSDDFLLLTVTDGQGGDAAGDYAVEIIRSRLAGIKHVLRNNNPTYERNQAFVQDIQKNLCSEGSKKIVLITGVEDTGSNSFVAQSLKEDLESVENKQRIMSKIVPLTRDEGQYTRGLALSRAKEERKSLTLVPLPPFNSEIVYSKRLEEPNAFDNQIELYEKEAQEKYEAAVKDLQDVELSGWLNCLLERRIIPGLRRIGFDGPLDWALFKMAAPSWKLMGPISDKDV